MTTPFLTTPSTDFRKNFFDDTKNDQWQSSSMLQDLSNAYLTSSVCDHIVQILKLELSTKAGMVEMWSNSELVEATASRSQQIKQNGKEDNVEHACNFVV